MKQACSGVFAVLVLAAVRSADAVTSSLMDVCATEIIACTTESEICQTCAVSSCLFHVLFLRTVSRKDRMKRCGSSALHSLRRQLCR